MAIFSMWKIRREILRPWAKIKVAIWRFWGNKTRIEYQGLSVPMNRSGMSNEVVVAIARDFYEKPEIRGLRLAVRTGDRVLELGSGLGIITALAARAVAPSGRVLSYEANPDLIPATLDFLAEHAVTNVELRHAVLVPQEATETAREFCLHESFASSSLLGTESHLSRGVISVPAQRLGDVISAFRPDILICDIEGGEAELIPSLDASGLRSAVIELHPDRISQAAIDAITAGLGRHGLHPAKEALGGTVVLYTRTFGA